MTLGYYFQALRKRWRAVLSIAFIGILASIGLTLASSPTYTGQATLYIRLAQTSNQQSATFAQSLVQSYPSQVDSPAVLAPVISELKLNMSVHQLDQSVSASNPPGTLNLLVLAESGTAARAQRLTNAVAHSLAREIDRLQTGKTSATAGTPLLARVTVPATLPAAPTSPRPVLNVAVGLLLGLAIGACVAIVREQMDTTVRTAEDLNVIGGSYPLGTVRYDSEFSAHALVSMHDDPGGLEDFRSIRTNLQWVDVDNPPRLIVVSSAVADEGKSVAACNIAITMAQSGVRVCLVEGDLRRPRVATYLGIDGTLGLTDVAAGTHRLDDALVPWHHDQITVLPAGTTPPDPAQLLGSLAMSEVLSELRHRFDLVLIDAPPLLPVSDAAVLGAVSDGVILIARYRHVRRDQFRAAIDALSVVRARHLGSVLTQVPKRRRAGGYSYSSTSVGGAAETWSMAPLPRMYATSASQDERYASVLTKPWTPPPLVEDQPRRPASTTSTEGANPLGRPRRRRRQIG